MVDIRSIIDTPWLSYLPIVFLNTLKLKENKPKTKDTPPTSKEIRELGISERALRRLITSKESSLRFLER